MKLIELHILQSFPVSCLNRDDVGAPKSAIFGGVPRARVSSQSFKRAIRLLAREKSGAGVFDGIRTRHLKSLFMEALSKTEIADPEKVSDDICKTLSKIDNDQQVTTAVYLSPKEIDNIVASLNAGESVKSAVKNAQRHDAADISLFGRMIANPGNLSVEGAAMFSHALSTHKVANEIDFFSAVDDHKPDSEDAGAGMIGTLEFNSALYYRYAALNLDLLADPRHLGGLPPEDRKAVVAHFINATLEAIPGARKNSMNAHTRPGFVLGTVKENGQPVQLINAFEKPIWTPDGQGIMEKSIEELKGHHNQLKDIWGIETLIEVAIPEQTAAEFVTSISSHVI